MTRERWLIRLIETSNVVALMTVVAAVTGLIAWLDALSGPDISFSFFYVLPLSLVAWRARTGGAIIGAVVAAIIWLSVDLLTDPGRSLGVPLWNGLIRGAFFVTIGLLLANLRTRLERESDLARIDALTGLVNRRSFTELATRELARSDRTGAMLTIVLIDLDDFKIINDTLGHAQGDAALQAAALSMTSSIRGPDVAARFGGDEFAMLLVGSEGATASVLQRVSDAVSRTHVGGVRIGCSIGAFTVDGGTLEHALAQADSMLYEAKRMGKGQIKVTSERTPRLHQG